MSERRKRLVAQMLEIASPHTTIWSDLAREWTDYVEDYVYDDGESSADYTPSEKERILLLDAMAGATSRDDNPTLRAALQLLRAAEANPRAVAELLLAGAT